MDPMDPPLDPPLFIDPWAAVAVYTHTHTHTNTLPYTSLAHAHRGIIDNYLFCSRFSILQKFRIFPNELSIAGGGLTPTMKLKRKIVLEKYGNLVEGVIESQTDFWTIISLVPCFDC